MKKKSFIDAVHYITFTCSFLDIRASLVHWPMMDDKLILRHMAHDPVLSTISLSRGCVCQSELNVKYNSDYTVQIDESLRGHCTSERRVRKRDKKVRRDVI